MTDKLEKSCSICSQLQTKCSQIEKEKLTLVMMLTSSEEKANTLSAELNGIIIFLSLHLDFIILKIVFVILFVLYIL